ncbi:hypothetical protein AURANDRAFT_5475, partial [Aureococcus anophagefferens]
TPSPPILVSQIVRGVVIVSYNRPQEKNPFDAALSSALVSVLDKLNTDLQLSAAIITGRGGYFCTAAKFDELLRPIHPVWLHTSLVAGIVMLFDSFITFSKPIVAAINGPAFGGGVTQATLCDMVLSLRHAKYSLTFSHWKVSPEGCASVHLARVIGISEAGKMLAGAWIPSSAVAKSIGLVSEVVAD